MKITKLLMAVAIITTTGFLSCKPKDADIKTAVEAKLSTKPDMTNTMVSVTDGVATISGECKDETCKADCEKMTSEVKGVKSVVNNLSVAPPPPPPVAMAVDDNLKTGVTDAIKDFSTVTADVTDGVVTLTGTIKKTDLPKVMMAISSLKPKKIDNKLTVK